MNSPIMNRSPQLPMHEENSQEENDKDWSKDAAPKTSISPSHPQAPQQLMHKGESFAQYVLSHPLSFKEPSSSRSDVMGLGNGRLESSSMNRFDALNLRIEASYPPGQQRSDPGNRFATVQHRFGAQASDCMQQQPKKKPKTDEDEFESSDPSQQEDDSEAFGKVVAVQLRSMNKVQKFIAQRLISEICFRGQFNHLQLTSNLRVAEERLAQPQQVVQQPQYSARPSQRFIRSGQEYTAFIHPQALRQVIPISSTVTPEFHNSAQSHVDPSVANLNAMEPYN